MCLCENIATGIFRRVLAAATSTFRTCGRTSDHKTLTSKPIAC